MLGERGRELAVARWSTEARGAEYAALFACLARCDERAASSCPLACAARVPSLQSR